MRIRFFFISSIFILFISSCSKSADKIIIASVYKKNLLLSEVIRDMPQKTKDSTFFIEQYMHAWIRKQLMIYYSEINLSADMKDYEKQIENYRANLLIYAYQQQLIDQNFDTTISVFSVTDYYDQYKEEFRLNKNIFKGRYVVVDKSAPRLSKLSKLYKSNDEKDIHELADFCQQFAKEYYLNDSNWQYFSFINNKLPEKIIKEDYFLRNTKDVYFEDDQFRYYVFINDYKIKGSISPLEIEKEKIRNILLNKNKIKYLRQLEDELYQNALVLKKIKIY